MHMLDRRARLNAAALAALAGYVDAIGFIGAGGFFLSFMSGNTTRFAAAVGERADYWLIPIALIAAFIVGVMAGHLVGARRAGHHRRALWLVALLLTLGTWITIHWPGPEGAWTGLFGTGLHMVGLLVVTAAMGAENTIFAENGDVRFGLTYMTGTLVRFGQRLADALSGQGSYRACWPLLAHWLCLAGGAMLGACVWQLLDFHALWLAAAVAAALALLARGQG